MNYSNYTKMKESFRSYLQTKGLTTKSIHTYLESIKLYWQWLAEENLQAENIRYHDLLLYMKHKSNHQITQRTMQTYMGTIKHYYDHLIQQGQVVINPAQDIEVKGVKRKSLYHILEPPELHRLYDRYPETNPRERRNKAMLSLLVYQGLTTEELGKLTTKDINLRTGQVTVPGGRKSNSRQMLLEAHQVMNLYDYTLQVRPLLIEMAPKRKSQTKQATDQLFIGEGGNCHSMSNLVTRLMVKVRKFNPQVINAKQLRASVITKWLKNYNLREVQYLAGHRYVSSTESYLQNDMEGLQEELNQFHPLG